MIGTVKNRNECIIGYIEWNLLTRYGQFGQDADHIYVSDIWIHDRFRETGVFRELIRIIDSHPFSKDAKKVYWDFARDLNGKRIFDDTREDFKNLKMSRVYDRKYIADKILKRGIRICLK